MKLNKETVLIVLSLLIVVIHSNVISDSECIGIDKSVIPTCASTVLMGEGPCEENVCAQVCKGH